MSKTMQIILVGIGLVFFAWLAFGDRGSDQEESVSAAPAANTPLFVPKAPPTAGGGMLSPAPGQPQATAASGPLNPAHGQPGHRCDIAVGAPLNTAPGQPAASPVLSQPNPVTPVAVNPVASPAPTVASGKNPPHGQPGHRCDIAVGAPLDSKPAQPAAATTQTATPAASPVSPVQRALGTTPAVAATPPGKNPPHGQPGHRCDIAVGASLDSAPAAKQ